MIDFINYKINSVKKMIVKLKSKSITQLTSQDHYTILSILEGYLTILEKEKEKGKQN